MKNIYRNIKFFQWVLVLVLIIGNTSCNDTMIEEEVFSFIAKENFYQNADDAESAIIGIYNGLQSDDLYGRWYFIMTNLTDDQVTIHRNPLFLQIENFNFSADHAYLKTFWTGIYSVINRANVAISRIPDIEMDQDLKNKYIAEAKCIRASMYFILVRLWGEVPLSLDEVGDEESANITKGSVDDIYDAIIEDLEYADDYLPLAWGTDNFGRVTQGAAKALLTDVLLTREDWSGAAAKAKEIIDGGQYSLLNNFSDIFSIENEKNSEIIHSIVFDGENAYTWLASFAHAGGRDNAMCYNGAQVLQADDKSDMWLNWDNNDPRKKFTVYEDYLSKNGTYKSVYNTSRPYPAFGKWNAPDESNTSRCPLDWIIYRYADVLLMYAEALSQANNGPTQAAYDAVNSIIRRGYGLPLNQVSTFDLETGLDAISFREAVIKQRSYEFVMEGKRLFDLSRIGQFPQILKDMGKITNSSATLFPIPVAEIDANSSLTNEDQNEGY